MSDTSFLARSPSLAAIEAEFVQAEAAVTKAVGLGLVPKMPWNSADPTNPAAI